MLYWCIGELEFRKQKKKCTEVNLPFNVEMASIIDNTWKYKKEAVIASATHRAMVEKQKWQAVSILS